MERAEEYRYYSASAGDLRLLSIMMLTLRISYFQKVHKQETRNRIILAGGKPK
jgi:hypothetical protein